jgi:tRNA1Val (adenine37-N6)-methyltransferase
LLFLQKSKILTNSFFRFKQFTIRQDKTAMKVGTDGVLLGAWANVSQAKRILDVGTGTGLIAIMMAQRSSAEIHAIEPESKAFEQAVNNVNNSPWPDRIHLSQVNFQEYIQQTPYGFDLIVSNPPYFKNSLQSPKEERNQARHARTLTGGDLIQGSLKIMNDKGKLSLILPFNEGREFTEIAVKQGLHCIRKTYIKPTPDKDAKRMLMEFSRQSLETIEDHLIIDKGERHNFTEEYRNLTRNFYLYF